MNRYCTNYIVNFEFIKKRYSKNNNKSSNSTNENRKHRAWRKWFSSNSDQTA